MPSEVSITLDSEESNLLKMCIMYTNSLNSGAKPVENTDLIENILLSLHREIMAHPLTELPHPYDRIPKIQIKSEYMFYKEQLGALISEVTEILERKQRSELTEHD